MLNIGLGLNKKNLNHMNDKNFLNPILNEKHFIRCVRNEIKRNIKVNGLQKKKKKKP